MFDVLEGQESSAVTLPDSEGRNGDSSYSAKVTRSQGIELGQDGLIDKSVVVHKTDCFITVAECFSSAVRPCHINRDFHSKAADSGFFDESINTSHSS